MRPSGTLLCKRVCPSVRPSVRWSVRRSVCPLRKCKVCVPRLFLTTMRSFTDSNDRQTCFESLIYYSSRFICLFVHVSLHICHMFNTRRDTAQTHRCPVGLVPQLFLFLCFLNLYLCECQKVINIIVTQHIRVYEHVLNYFRMHYGQLLKARHDACIDLLLSHNLRSKLLRDKIIPGPKIVKSAILVA